MAGFEISKLKGTHMKSLFQVNYLSVVGIVSAIVFSSSVHALIIDTSVSAVISHQVNDKYVEYAVGPQLSLGERPDALTVPDIHMNEGSGYIYNFAWTDDSGRDLISSNASNAWISLEKYGNLNEFQPYNFRNQVVATRKTVITNNTINDVGLSIDYLIDGGGIGFQSAFLTPDENLFALASNLIVLNSDNYLWLSGAFVMAGEPYGPFGVLNTYADNMNGTSYSWSDENGAGFGYRWDSQHYLFDFGVLKAGESITLEQKLRTRVSGSISHCIPRPDTEFGFMSCLDSVAHSVIGYWSEESVPLSIQTYSVPEPSSLYLLLLSVLGIFMMRTRKDK